MDEDHRPGERAIKLADDLAQASIASGFGIYQALLSACQKIVNMNKENCQLQAQLTKLSEYVVKSERDAS